MTFEAPPLKPCAPAAFGLCTCDHRIYDHGRIGKDGNQVWTGCRHCDCTTYRASDGSAWPNFHGGATPQDPTDLDVDTDAWVDGQVLLSHEREPDLFGDAA